MDIRLSSSLFGFSQGVRNRRGVVWQQIANERYKRYQSSQNMGQQTYILIFYEFLYCRWRGTLANTFKDVKFMRFGIVRLTVKIT